MSPFSLEGPGDRGSADGFVVGLGVDALALSDAELVALPKVDLHVHLVGSAAPHTVTELAARHAQAGVPADLASLRQFYAFRDFAHFLEVYTAVSALVRTPQDLVALVVGLGADLQGQGVDYAEVTVTPVTHIAASIGADELAQALTAGAAQVRGGPEVELAWVYDVSGGDGPPGARATLQAALRHAPVGWWAGGLVGWWAGGLRARRPRNRRTPGGLPGGLRRGARRRAAHCPARTWTATSGSPSPRLESRPATRRPRPRTGSGQRRADRAELIERR